MRISDWSSDVCSSDLFVTFARTPELRLSTPATDLVAYSAETITVSGETAPNARVTLAGLRHNQIGRASCRERVCEYVSISVVAVSVKRQGSRSLNKERQVIMRQPDHHL